MTERAKNPPLSNKNFQEDVILSSYGDPSMADNMTPLVDEREEPQILTSQQPTSKSIDVKAKLENLRKLFAEEDMNDALKDIQGEWGQADPQL